MSDQAEANAEAIYELVKETLDEHQSHRAPSWVQWVAMTTMGLALLSALCALLAGITANQSVLERTREIIEISIIEGDRVTAEVLRSKHDLLREMGREPPADELSRLAHMEREISELRADAEREEATIQKKIHAHEIFAVGLTLLSIAITLNGMAVLMRRRNFWRVGLSLGAVGSLSVLAGLVAMIV